MTDDAPAVDPILPAGVALLGSYGTAFVVTGLYEAVYWQRWNISFVQLWSLHDLASLPFRHIESSLGLLGFGVVATVAACARWGARGWAGLLVAWAGAATAWVATADSTAQQRMGGCVEVSGVDELAGSCRPLLGRIGDNYVFLLEGANPLLVDTKRVTMIRAGSPASNEPGVDNQLRAGGMIPVVVDGFIDASPSGPVAVVVSSNVLDSAGARVLIPRGARFFGAKAAAIKAGEPVAVTWDRLQYPDGCTLELGAVNKTGTTDVFGGLRLSDRGFAHLGQLSKEAASLNMELSPDIEIAPGATALIDVQKALMFDGPCRLSIAPQGSSKRGPL